MEKIKEILNELGISKVKLAKYLGVSRQMIYNYLELDNINKWPKEKKVLLYKLLNIEDGDPETIDNIKVTTEYMDEVEERLNCINKSCGLEYIDVKGLNKEEQILLSDFTFLLKEKLTENDNKENYYIVKYLYNVLQSVDNIPELKYLLGYVSKSTGFTEPNEFAFNEDKQFMFEGIIHSAFSLFSSGGASKNRVILSRDRFISEIEQRNEEKLSRTQELITVRVQALRELGYDKITTQNAAEVFEKIAEIQSRGV
ncbi:MAG: helix-turn-helix domain-containing protein [Bacilli bacterium]|nr:helix-turn-helix domain-containing protein [Bacilli bacterium]